MPAGKSPPLALHVDVWADYVCPWCYLGDANLQAALDSVPGLEVTVTHRAFELDPHRTASTSVHEFLEGRYGPGSALPMTSRVAALGAQAGLKMDFSRAVVASTHDAHRVGHLARTQGLGAAWARRAMRAHFEEGADLADSAVLRGLAADVGLDADAVAAVLTSDMHSEAVHAEAREAASLGAGGVPFFVVGGRLALRGAQPPAVLADALRRVRDLGDETQPNA